MEEHLSLSQKGPIKPELKPRVYNFATTNSLLVSISSHFCPVFLCYHMTVLSCERRGQQTKMGLCDESLYCDQEPRCPG